MNILQSRLPCSVAASRRGHLARPTLRGAAWQLRPCRIPRGVRGAASGGDALPGSIQGIMAELRADPALAPVLDSPRLQRALQELKEDPGRALAKYATDKQVMAVISRLTTLGLKDASTSPLLSRMGTSAPDLAASLFSDGGQLAARLNAPRVRQALAEIRARPEEAMAKYENDKEVMAVLDLLQARLEANGVIDV